MIGFDNEKYLKMQSEEIKKRIKMFDSKLYIEFGGKLFDDLHAARVLPGFKKDSKIQILRELKEDLEVVFCINANDIEKKKERADFGITYDLELFRLIDNLETLDIYVSSVVITLYKGQQEVTAFRKKLEDRGIRTYVHTYTKGYPTDIDTIVSEEGYGKNEYIETSKKMVVVTAPGPNSGKLATCLSQLYHEYKRGVKAGYAKFETFPVWNLPLKHPVNVAYEAATADLNDVNMLDSFHLDAYGVKAVNYNRDLSTFPILKNIIEKITKDEIYKSPTDMGVNMVGNCIVDEKVVEEAAKEEIVRRYYNARCDARKEKVSKDVPERIKVLMNELHLSEKDRDVAVENKKKKVEKGRNVCTIKLKNGKMVTGKETDLLTPVSSAVLNAIKEVTKIEDSIFLLSPSVLKPIIEIKEKTMLDKNQRLNLHEVLIALSICKVTNPVVEKALENISALDSCEAHASYIIPNTESKILKKLNLNITCDDKF